MKLSLIDVVLMRGGLTNLGNVKLPIKRAFALMRFTKAVDNEISLYNEKRKQLIEKYGTPSDKVNIYTFTDDKAEEFNRDMKDLGEIEIELPDIDQFTLTEIQNDYLSSNDLLVLEPLFK